MPRTRSRRCLKACATVPRRRHSRRCPSWIWTPWPRCSRLVATAVTDWCDPTDRPKHGAVLRRGKSWVLAMLAAKRRLRVAPVPPQAADLPCPARGAWTAPGRDEGTAAAVEPRNCQGRGLGLALDHVTCLQSLAQWWVRLNQPHTQKFGWSPEPLL